MREGVEGLGEGAYCLTQLASALEFARHADASVLADVTEEELNRVRSVCVFCVFCVWVLGGGGVC